MKNINPDNLLAVKKHQNKLTEYRRMLISWKSVGIMTFRRVHLGLSPPRSGFRDLPRRPAVR